MMPGTPLLHIRHLGKTFASWPLPLQWLKPAGTKPSAIHALRDVTLSADVGEVLGIIGPNGAGKTTLLKIIAGLVAPTTGEIYLGGEKITPSSDARSIHCSLVGADERSFYWRLTGRQNLRFFATFAGLGPSAAENKIDALLAGMEIADPDRLVAEYSSGMKQRLAVARGLLRDQPLLLFDEATRSLDPGAREKFLGWVRGRLVREEKKSILWATHDLTEAEAICGRICILLDGRVRAVGSPVDLKRHAGLAEDAALHDAYRALSRGESDQAPRPRTHP